MKKLTAIFLTLAILCLPVPCFAAPTAPPRASVVCLEAIPVGKTFTCSFLVYSANGFSSTFKLRPGDIEITGNGKAEIVSVETISNSGQYVNGNFKLKATYPGKIRVYIKGGTFRDSEGVYNIGSVPRSVDLKIFNIDGENAYEKMTDFEYYLTYFVAPFWSVFNSIKKLFK